MKLEVYNAIKQYMAQLIKGTEYENKVFCVGGCCRDEILKNDIKDIDIVIELPNGGINFAEWLYKNHYTNGGVVTYPTYGTAMFKLDKFPNVEIEAVQTRSEKYIDRSSRNPTTDYGTIKEDCMRRDLTINAIYCNVSTGEFLDICGTSLNDIAHHIIRTPCDPDITYIDDPLRIMRCIRFAARYNWEIENDTYQALIRNVNRLSIISAERITDEFDKIVSNNDPSKVFVGVNLLAEINVFNYIFPSVEIRTDLMLSPLLKNMYTRIATLLYNADNVKELLINRKYSNDIINRILSIIRISKTWDNISEMNDEIQRHIQYDCKTPEMFMDVCNVMCVIDPTMHTVFRMLKKDVNHYNYKLPVNGDDIMSFFKLTPGPAIRSYLNLLIQSSFKFPDLTKKDCLNIIKGVIDE